MSNQGMDKLAVVVVCASLGFAFNNCSNVAIETNPMKSITNGQGNPVGGGGGVNPTPTPGGTPPGPSSVEQQHFATKISPMFTQRCSTCHSEPRFGGLGGLSIFNYTLMRQYLLNGPSAVNNQLINKMQSIIAHSGGTNVCPSGVTATPCKEITEWWSVETKQTASGYLGSIDSALAHGTIYGWAASVANPGAILTVYFYHNDTGVGLGTLIGSATANLAGPNNVGPSVGHYFNFTVPAQFRDGVVHKLYAYAAEAKPENALPSSGLQYASYNQNPAARTYFNNTVKPAMTACAACHSVEYDLFYYALITPPKYQGGTALNNNIINKPTNTIMHGGGNVCGNKNASPCSLFQTWWTMEFGP